ncbi:unnamed protein product, partial [marine sediment metagenome]
YVIIPFNIKMPLLGNNTDSAWLDYRLDIFRCYTLRSLINQKDSNLRTWMICSPESKDVLMPKIEAMRREYEATMSKVDFIFDEEEAYSHLEGNSESIYFLKIGSDDLYHKNVTGKVRQTLSPLDEMPMLMFSDGYIYDIYSKRLSTYVRWSMPTIAVKFGPDFFSTDNFRRRFMCDSTKVRGRFEPILIRGRMVCCLDHKMNLHSDPRRKGVEMEYRTGEQPFNYQERAPAILKEFGVEV